MSPRAPWPRTPFPFSAIIPTSWPAAQTGFALLSSGSVQEAQDFAAIGHAATLESRVPFLHFFDGFRTSHEVAKIRVLTDEQLRELMDEYALPLQAFRNHGLSPDRPCIRGTAQNPDVFFQAREACNPYYDRAPGIVQEIMNRFAGITGRQYRLFDYAGHPQAERVLVIMGSGGETAQQTAEWLNQHGEKTGVLKVRLYRPFSVEAFIGALPSTTRRIAVLDRTKEPGAVGEPLYVDTVTALREGCDKGLASFDAEPSVVGGRYGLSSKEFTPAMVKSIFDALQRRAPKNHFTSGIVDDVTHASLPFDPEFDIEPKDVVRAVFFGLGADGTVGANKNSIKIIGEETDLYAQGYFVYDSKKSGAVTISHLRFGPHPIHSPFLIKRADFVACHQWPFLERYNVVDYAKEGATLLLNSQFGPDEVWNHFSLELQREIIAKKLKCHVIDAYSVAKATGMGGRINTIMQTCFFAISNVLPREEAIAQIKKAIQKTYARKGQAVVDQNFAAVDQTLAALHEVKIPHAISTDPSSGAHCSGGSARFCPADHRGDAGRQGRFAARQRVPGGWHMALRHHSLGKTGHCAGNSRMGHRHLHPMQQVRPGLPARRHSGQVLSRQPNWPMPRPGSNPPPFARRNGRTHSTRSRSRRKIAPDARSAWPFARSNQKPTPN